MAEIGFGRSIFLIKFTVNRYGKRFKCQTISTATVTSNFRKTNMNEQEFIKAVVEKVNNMNDFDKRNMLAEQDNINKIEELVEFINSILTKHKIDKKINKKHIRFYAGFIGNILKIEDKKLSHIIFDHYFPIPEKNTYYHYTSFENAKNIVESQKLRLYNLNKRFDDGEFTTFYEEHGMDGYKNGETVLGIDCSNKSIMSEIFYMSLTGAGTGSLYNSLWKDFGENGEGVRLEFSVNPKTNDFREVYYSKHNKANNIPLLKQLFQDIQAKYSKPFNFTYSSKIGAFYIKGKYNTENEFRFIVKRTSDDYGAYHLKPIEVNPDKAIRYIEIPFINDYANLKLKSIQLGYDCSEDDEKEVEKWISKQKDKPKILNKAINEEY